MMLSLFEDIFITDGFNRSLLMDVTRGKYYLIPKMWSKIISHFNKNILVEDIALYLQRPGLLEVGKLYRFLTEKELVFDISEDLLQYFPKIKEEYETPSLLDDIFITISLSNIDFLSILCDSSIFKSGNIFTFRLFVEDEVLLKQEHKLNQIINKLPLSSLLIIVLNESLKSKMSSLLKKKNVVITCLEMPIGVFFFQEEVYKDRYPLISIDMPQIMGSKSHNMYYHKSVFITSEGYISNSFEFSMRTKVHLKDIITDGKKFEDLIAKPFFKRLGNIPLSKVEICKDCEFRRVCIDCRVPRLSGNYWQKEDCLYNPFISKWKTDSGYVASSSCGKYLNNGSFERNGAYIVHKNEELWGFNPSFVEMD